MTNEVETARRTLLKYYYSECMTHGGYIIALSVGAFTVISTWDMAFYLTNVKWYVYSIMLSGILALGVHTIGRTMYWGYLAWEVLNAKPKKRNEKDTLILELHIQSDSNLRIRKGKCPWIAKKFYRFRFDILFFSFLISFLVTNEPLLEHFFRLLK